MPSVVRPSKLRVAGLSPVFRSYENPESQIVDFQDFFFELSEDIGSAEMYNLCGWI